MKPASAAPRYFLLAFAISWLAGAAVTARYWTHGEAPPRFAGLMMFPAMLLGPSLGGLVMIGLTGGRAGLKEVAGSMRRTGPVAWLGAILIPPLAILTVLWTLTSFVSPAFTPNHFWVGYVFGISAGFFEEIGWTGFAFPALRARHTPLAAAVTLGLLWSLWHLPVVDFLGSASPHGRAWLPFFLAFALAMTALRVLICWVYTHTNSVLSAQAIHAASTGSLAALGPAGVTAGQEAFWYAMYGVVLWAVVAIVAPRFNRISRR